MKNTFMNITWRVKQDAIRQYLLDEYLTKLEEMENGETNNNNTTGDA